MSLQSGYNLAKLKVIYTSRLRDDLSKSVTKLRNTLDSAGALNGVLLQKPMPSRLPRRAWRVWYNKAPHAIGWSKRHYVFHDWRYAFTFRDVSDTKRTVSSILGSMAPDTMCEVEFVWNYHGSPEYQELIGLTDHERVAMEHDMEKGRARIVKKNEALDNIKASDQSIQKHLYFNPRQYVGNT